MHRTKHHRIKLLITLVLFTVAVAAVWMSTQADARGLMGPGASSVQSSARPGAQIASGEPDAGQGYTAPPPPPPQLKQSRWLPGNGDSRASTIIDWFRWAGRIWATLYLRAAH